MRTKLVPGIVVALIISMLAVVAITSSSTQASAQPDECKIDLYSDSDWTDRIFTYTGEVRNPNLQGMDDRASSVELSGCDAVVARDHDAGGWCFSLAPGRYALPEGQMSYLDLDAKGCPYTGAPALKGRWIKLDDIGNHGMPPRSRCPYGVPARGFGGTVSARSIENFQITCSVPGISGIVRGYEAQSNNRGESGFETNCQSGQVAVGASGTAYMSRGNGLVYSIRPLCVALDANGQWSGDVSRGSLVGNDKAGHSYKRVCPKDTAIAGAEMWTGNGLDGLTLLCSPIVIPIEPCPVLPAPTPFPPAPTSTPVPPTATPIPPTATPTPIPTSTPTPTSTPVPPTATPTPTATAVPPTATPTPTATAVPPTATPTPTATPIPPTATPTPSPTPAIGDVGDAVDGDIIPTNQVSKSSLSKKPTPVPKKKEPAPTATKVPPTPTPTPRVCPTPEPVGSIGDRVWYDLDKDGVQEAGEGGINGVLVELYNDDDQLVATDRTRGNGNYSFDGYAAGEWTVRLVPESLPPNAVHAYELDGDDDAIVTVDLAAGQNRRDVDFGYSRLATPTPVPPTPVPPTPVPPTPTALPVGDIPPGD